MNIRILLYEVEAERDIDRQFDWLVAKASLRTAERVMARLRSTCEKITLAPTQGRRADAIRPGMRITGFEGAHAICFTFDDDHVRILRVLFGGRDPSRAFGLD